MRTFTKNLGKFAWVVIVGIVLLRFVLQLSSKSAGTAIELSSPEASHAVRIATDPTGVPVAPFSLNEPPAPTSESTPEQRQLLSVYESVLRNTRGGHKYNLACSYSLVGDVGAAIYWLQRAAREDGVDPDWAMRDQDLAAVRADERGTTLFAYFSRMAEHHEKHPLDRQILSLPKDYRLGRPIPMLIGMHGFGSVPEDFSDGFSKMADTLGIALLAVSATKTRGPQSFVWREDVESDAKRIEAAIVAVSDRVTIAGGQIYLIGFSQGGQLALEIASKYSERFAGAIAMSPGTLSPMERIGFGSTMLTGHRFVIVAGEKEHPSTLAAARISKERLSTFGAKVFYRIYPDVATHRFPADYYDVLPKWLAFLVSGRSPNINER